MDDSLDDLRIDVSARLRIAPLRVDDAQALSAISDSPEILDVIHFLPSPFGEAEATALIRAKGDGRDCFLGLWVRTEDALAGVFGVHLQANGRIEIGYWIDPSRHGQGYATEAGQAVLAQLKRRFPGRRIVAHALPTNLRSLNVLAKLGFEPSHEAPTRPERNLFVLRA